MEQAEAYRAEDDSLRQRKPQVSSAFPLALLLLTAVLLALLGFGLKQASSSDNNLKALLASLETALCIEKTQQPVSTQSPHHPTRDQLANH
ncbi:hypothetical protein [Hyphomicrobium sp. D-2]|uniref:hypothetical protein n=1 Tax=Hyphomicrobium sp. D-2 TaxID=3041621 RepID=UPI0024586CFB|nr:hypothetical protein [Hyphomicrobium sp. D-2]MDH4980709.1 hypothetical protein [Hyphomicrobium sp. D-2]